ncbi:nucleotidyltransferase [Alkaliphilus transvaalensis]|uniref:nucleotidyltransferase n=1 Tax=Alkaliphilus transvaalensis TaxID=114628 RepID=UPI00047DC35F|nr:nucleotidyltransferase [Alkaliphilus transvaalensis]
MKVLGLITEYNPFHNGHLYHLQESLKVSNATHSIAVMSGNFLQRGEPALLHKWARAKMAVSAGVDLVLEIPTLYACATAEHFAYGSVKLLDETGIVDALCFGSEEGNLKGLQLISDVLVYSPEAFKCYLQSYLQQGLSFPVARENALKDYFNKAGNFSEEETRQLHSIIKNPNNILSIEYLKALKRINSKILPHTILRVKAGYHSTDISSNIASATAIREHLKRKVPLEELMGVIPVSTYSVLRDSFKDAIGPIFSHQYQQSIMTLIRRSSLDDLRNIPDVNEGLENRIKECGLTSNDYGELLENIKSKRYTLTRIQRILMHLLLNISKSDFDKIHQQGGPQYIRVLAFNDKGRELLRLMKDKARLPVINKLSHYIPQNEAATKMLEIDVRATDLYHLGVKNSDLALQQQDFLQTPYYHHH